MGLLKTVAVSVSALSMVALPVAANAADAGKLSVSKARASAPTAKSEKALGGSGIIVGVLAAAAVIAGIVVVADGGDDADSN